MSTRSLKPTQEAGVTIGKIQRQVMFLTQGRGAMPILTSSKGTVHLLLELRPRNRIAVTHWVVLSFLGTQSLYGLEKGTGKWVQSYPGFKDSAWSQSCLLRALGVERGCRAMKGGILARQSIQRIENYPALSEMEPAKLCVRSALGPELHNQVKVEHPAFLYRTPAGNSHVI